MMKSLSYCVNKFKKHVVEVCNDREKIESYLVCDDGLKKKLFTRSRVWTFAVMVNAILLCFKKTLTSEITEFLLSHDMPQTTPEAYIKRRGYISSEFFRDLNCFLIKDSLDSGLVKRWRGHKFLCGIDGTRLSLPYTPELYRKYRNRKDRGHNLARGAFITDLLNRTVVAADLYPNKTEERKAALELLSSHEFPYPIEHTVFVMDRGYPALYLMDWFHENTGGFIIRARRDTNPAIASFMDSDKTHDTVTLCLSKSRRDINYPRPKPLTVRLVKRPPMADDDLDTEEDKTEPVVFMTDLAESDFPDDTIAQAYRMRWHSETEIGTEKNELQIEIFSGIRDICIQQDFFAAAILYNFESLIRIPCNRHMANNKGKYDIQVDMNCTWQLTISILNMIMGPPETFDEQLTFTVKLFLKFISIERPGRSLPRHKRVIKLSGKYITLTNYKRGI